ncbi:hypothetical protein GWK48_08275 [Metallosphaera tengchongensis]|uniref:Uncharacterized protein n=1 Tax=Metallosphaera tengchongensis TaxID=1532350 RepID=A0A6N0NYB4_9CREN|nr:hypothetical protein [Metallosphaera tengchongensis]QKR00368.1 hypothetical protein GWK48_08275 [Metallosphaera tengchongensis]
MELLETQELFERIRSMINSSSQTLILLTDKISDFIAEDLLRKAGSGVDVTLITGDLNWARWLENKATGYMKDEEEKISQEIRALSERIELYGRIPWITLTVIGAIWIILLIRGVKGAEILLAILIGLAALFGITFFSLRKRSSCTQEITVKFENKQRIADEYKGVRESLSKHLHIDEIEFEVSFTVIVSDNEAVITSTPLSTGKEKGYHVVTDISRDDAMKIVDHIQSKRASKQP